MVNTSGAGDGRLDLVEAKLYIAQVRWRYAKTMPDWPHEYTIKAWRPEMSGAFEQLCRLIQDEGQVAAWPPPPAAAIYHNAYLVITPHRYWAMGPRGDQDPITERTVINRALV